MSTKPASIGKRTGAALLDILTALLLAVVSFSYLIAPAYNQVFNLSPQYEEMNTLRVESHLYVEDEDVTRNLEVTAQLAAIYDYYALFKDGKTYLKAEVPFVFTPEWYNSEVLKIGSVEEGVVIYFAYQQTAGDDDPSLIGEILPEHLNTDGSYKDGLKEFISKTYLIAQEDFINYEPYNKITMSLTKHLNNAILIAVGLALLLIYLIIPFIFRNGQTLFKRVFALAVVDEKSGLAIKWWQVLARFTALLLTIYLSIWTMLGAILISYTLMIFTKNYRSGNDFLSFTKVVDAKNSLIFKTQEEALAFEASLTSQKKVNQEDIIDHYEPFPIPKLEEEKPSPPILKEEEAPNKENLVIETKDNDN